MPRYADPTRCPDCRAELPPSPQSCPRCDLPLRGPLALTLHATLSRADRLLEQLRATRATDRSAERIAHPWVRVRALR